MDLSYMPIGHGPTGTLPAVLTGPHGLQRCPVAVLSKEQIKEQAEPTTKTQSPPTLPAKAVPSSPFTGQDDSRVVQSFLDGEARAFTELVVRYQTRLLNFVFRTIGDRER